MSIKSSLMQVKVASRNTDGEDYCEGTVTIPGLKPTKIIKKSDGSSRFPNRGVLMSAARSLATSLNFSGVGTDEDTGSKTNINKTAATRRNLSSSVPSNNMF